MLCLPILKNTYFHKELKKIKYSLWTDEKIKFKLGKIVDEQQQPEEIYDCL